MKNKNVGFLILGISVLIIIIILIFNNAIKTIINEGCPAVHAGYSCPAFTTITQQTYLAIAITGVIVTIGLVLIFTQEKEKIIIKKVNIKNKKGIEISLKELKLEEKQVLKLIQEQKAMFQADLIEKLGMGKVKISRILDKLENKNLIERKRRGMNNLVIFKD